MPAKKSALHELISPAHPFIIQLRDGTKIELLLSFDFNAAAEIQQKIGLNITEGQAFWEHYWEPSWIRAMLWACLLARQPEYAGEEGLRVVGSYIYDENLLDVQEAIFQAYLLYLPEQTRNNILKAREEAKAKAAKAKARKEAGLAPEPEDDFLAEKPSLDQAGSNSTRSPDTILESAKASSGA